jgi:hypothetical protein
LKTAFIERQNPKQSLICEILNRASHAIPDFTVLENRTTNDQQPAANSLAGVETLLWFLRASDRANHYPMCGKKCRPTDHAQFRNTTESQTIT